LAYERPENREGQTVGVLSNELHIKMLITKQDVIVCDNVKFMIIV